MNMLRRRGPDMPGRGAFTFLLILIPFSVLISLGWLGVVVINDPETAPMRTTVTIQPDGSPITTTYYFSPTVDLGAADPALGKTQGFFIGPILALIGAMLETALLLIFAAFYVFNGSSDPNVDSGKKRRFLGFPLGLPKGTVRVFLLIIIVLTLLIFALLPEAWGNNKAVSFLFGLFSTVVGFYFGTRAEDDKPSGGGENGGNGNVTGDQTAPETPTPPATTTGTTVTAPPAAPGGATDTAIVTPPPPTAPSTSTSTTTASATTPGSGDGT